MVESFTVLCFSPHAGIPGNAIPVCGEQDAVVHQVDAALSGSRDLIRFLTPEIAGVQDGGPVWITKEALRHLCMVALGSRRHEEGAPAQGGKRIHLPV